MTGAEAKALEQTAANVRELKVLPGTPYSAYAIPVEYPPSRDFRPRWGFDHPVIPQLAEWFDAYRSDYSAFIEKMRSYSKDMSSIPIEFDEANLPHPAWNGVPYAPFDAAALYTMMREHKPRHYLEIGSGITTCIAKKAIVDGHLPTTVTSIDPEPRAKIDGICDRIIREGLETCDLSIFDQLEAGDILFFDGTHRSFMNSDVTVLMIDILPRLKPGVIVHIHDIALPYDYADGFVNWYWNEQYILAVYLMGNMKRINPLLPTTFICKDERLSEGLNSPIVNITPYNRGWHDGGAMWFTHTSHL